MRLVNEEVVDYLKVVYGRKMGVSLVEEFVRRNFAVPLQSGEFDALSYAFYKSAFLFIENSHKRIDFRRKESDIHLLNGLGKYSSGI